ncbi:hypothetical protein BC834DRAFT_821187 [Gloeopeniophorella convolvens]|nr:hypothetical protein BC834DRAFT_821187 [Gloeopeniophorella convolvens]
MATTAGPTAQDIVNAEDKQSALTSIQAQIDVLTDLSKRFQVLRQFPVGLLRNPHASKANAVLQQVSPTSTLKGSFAQSIEDLRTLRAAAVEESAQAALRAATESEKKDSTDIKTARERQGMKRRRSLTPESPRPLLALRRKVPGPFPPLPEGALPLTVKELPAFVRDFNATHAKKIVLHVYLASPREARDITVPLVLRFLIPDVLKAFVNLGYEEGVSGPASQTAPLMVENVTVFGSREKASSRRVAAHIVTGAYPAAQKPPHSQSEYIIFQKLSQWIVRMLQSSPRAPAQNIVEVLVAYKSLFLEKCSLCQRFLSAEGYLPPVARVWREKGDSGAWESQHATCVHS